MTIKPDSRRLTEAERLEAERQGDRLVAFHLKRQLRAFRRFMRRVLRPLPPNERR